MSRLGGIGNPNATSVIGDKNTYMATATPSLNSLNTQDPYVGITSSSGDFGIYDKLMLDTSITETFDHEFYPTSYSNTGTGNSGAQIVFQGSLPNWTRSEEIYLNIPVTIYNNNGGYIFSGSPIPLDPIFCLDNSARQFMQYTSPQSTTAADNLQTSTFDMNSLMFPDFALLHLFNRAQIFMGNNSQPLGRTSAMNLAGIKVNAGDNKFDDNRIAEVGLWGCPASVLDYSGYVSTYINNRPTGYVGEGGNMHNINPKWLDAFKSVLMTSSTLVTGKIPSKTTVTSSYPNKNDSAASNIVVFEQTSDVVNLPLPLYMLNSFFKGDKMLPPDTKFKIDLYMRNEAFLIATSPPTNVSLKIGNNNLFREEITFAVKLIDAPKLVMRSHSIKQDLQLAINTKWQTMPFLYNYETYEPYELSCNTLTNPYIMTIAISQQRPTELFIRVVDTVTSIPRMNQNGDDVTVFGDLTYADSLCGNLLPDKRNIKNNIGIIQGGGGWAIFDVKIKFQGRCVYWYRRNATSSANNIPTEYDRLNSKYRAASYQKYGNNKWSDGTFNITNCTNGGTSMDFIIAPGGMVDTGFLPADQGAQHIIVEISTTQQIPKDKKIQIWKKLPEQISFDINKNANVIMWPAIKSNDVSMIASTVNTQ